MAAPSTIQGDAGEPMEIMVDVAFGEHGMRPGARYFSAPFGFGRHCGIVWLQDYSGLDPPELRIAIKLFSASIRLYFLGFFVETPDPSINDDGFLSHVWPEGIEVRTTHARFLSVGTRREDLRDRLVNLLRQSTFARIRVFIAAQLLDPPPPLPLLSDTPRASPDRKREKSTGSYIDGSEAL